MAIINGTDDGETLSGTSAADTINALGGGDTIFGGGGVDRLFGGDGNDTIILDGQVGVSGPGGLVARYDGGSGFDTLELRPAGINFVTAGAAQTNYGLAGAEFSGIERIVFASTASNGILVSLLAPTIAANGPIELVGGAGIDSFVTVAFSSTGGTFTMPSFTLTNWTTLAQPYRQSGSDFLVLFAAGAGNFTLNALNGLNATQAMFGQAGNDTLNGSDGTDILNGNGGANQLFGNGGDDVLVIANTVAQTGPSSFASTTFTGAGSTFDGGDGFDVLSVGGVVNFAGSLAGIEGIYLQRAFASPNPGGAGSQAAAYLTLYASQLASLPGNLSLDGTGTVQVVVNGSENFNGSAYRFEAGSNVTFFIDGQSDNLAGTVTYVGTSNGDRFSFGEGHYVATGGGGVDVFAPGEGDTTITDFTPGVDKLDFSSTGITGVQRLSDFIVSTGPNFTIRGESGGQITQFTLQGVTQAQLDFGRDFIFNPGGQQNIEFGGATNDLLFGFNLNDELHGGGGNDRLYGGGGIDKLYGDAGDDTIILDGLVGANTSAISAIYDGGTGIDTLELRPAGLNFFSTTGSFSSYGLLNGTPGSFTGIEKITFASTPQTGILVSLLTTQITANQMSIGVPLELIGGTGNDTFVAVAFSPTGGEFAMPEVTLTNWTTALEPYRQQGGDILVLIASGAGDYTLKARDGLSANQALLGAAGNDILDGSTGTDILNGNGGQNSLFGNGGDDVLVIANTVVQTTPGIFVTTTFTGFGSTFDGGSGFDVLSVGGVVNFAGSLLTGIEGIYLQRAFASANRGGVGSQVAAHLSFDGTLLPSLPGNLSLDGTGTITIDLDPGDVYNGSAYVNRAGSNVTVEIIGSSVSDTITLGAAREVVTDDGGIDTAVFAGASTGYAVSAGPGGAVLIGNDSLTNIEYFRFSDGTFFWDGSSLVATPQGTIADGYLAGATVWIDVDGDSVQDADEPFTISDGAGNFAIVSTAAGPLRASGGTNIDTSLPNTLVLSAPGGSGVINPLTTLIERLVEGGTNLAAAEAAVESAFGLAPGLALTQLDLLAASASGGAALEAQKAAATVAEVLGTVVENGGSQAAALAALAVLVKPGGTVDLTTTATLTAVISAGLPGENVSALVTQTQAVTQAIDGAQNLHDIQVIQANTAPTAVADSANVNEDASATGNLLGNDRDPDAGDLLTVLSVGGSTLVGATVIAGRYGTLTVSPDGQYTYVADADVVDAYASGTVLGESFVYAIGDGHGGLATATLNVTVVTDAHDTVITSLGNGKNSFAGVFANDDVVTGGRGADSLSGNDGADRLYGGQGDDMLAGGNGFDLLSGGQGADRLDGGAGDDLLIGGKGGDRLTGGAGADVFDFSLLDGSDRDTILDFQVGLDHIHLSDGLSVTGQSESGGSTTLALSNGGSIVLAGVIGIHDFGGLFSNMLPDWSNGLPIA